MSVAESGFSLLPPHYLELEGPAVFLAGPIQGAEKWQVDATKELQRLDPKIHVCSPRRLELVKGGFGDADNAAQVAWETHYLRRCAANGGIIFWLAAESYSIPGRAYAQTTRFELGEWKERAQRGEAKLVVGIDEGFTNSRYIRHRFETDCPSVPICSTLEETCAAMVAVLATS